MVMLPQLSEEIICHPLKLPSQLGKPSTIILLYSAFSNMLNNNESEK